MKNVFSNVLECIGNTPLVRINRLNPNSRVTIYAKLEFRNPGGSIKDRPALSMIEAAEREGALTPGKIIIEATSGNTGIGLAIVAAVKGYRIVLAMPETASMERQKILRALGAELLLTPGSLGTDGSIEEAYNLVRENPDRYFLPDQFNNPANPAAHYRGTGPEIYEQTEGKVSAVVTTLGTTGTAMGILKAMKERNPNIQVIGVEPYPGHKIQGLKNMKESYVPGIFDRHALDDIVFVKDEEAFEMARRLAREEGIFAGMSCGAAMAAAVRIAADRTEGTIVAILPDGGDRYLSTNLFTTMLEPDFKFFDSLQRQVIDFKPVHEGQAGMFVTGPRMGGPLTLHESRRFLLADLLTRFLQVKGFAVTQVILIPDLHSRTIQGAIDANLDLASYAQQQCDRFVDDLDRLKVLRAQRYPRIGEHIEAITSLGKTLLNKGIAYEKLRSVYFNISQSRDYGALSRVNIKKIRLGSTVDLDAYEKLNPRDFTLLRRTTLAELKRGIFIKSDWGNVLPTWHIAASAVALQQLGTPVDIQVSSVDFLFPHLENVRAISEALTGKAGANVWMLCEQTRADKNAAEAGELTETASIQDLLAEGFSSAELRYWLLNAHYRKPFHVSRTSLRNSAQGYRRIKEFISRLHHVVTDHENHQELSEQLYALEQDFFAALSDDLNMPTAVAGLFKFIRQVNPIMDRNELSVSQKEQILEAFKKLDAILGIFDLDLKPLSDEEKNLITHRQRVRSEKNWQEADRLRIELQQRGIRVFDTARGVRWERFEG